VPPTRLAPGPLRQRCRAVSLPERRRLPLPGPLSGFQGPLRGFQCSLRSFQRGGQLLDSCAQTGDLRPQIRVLDFQFSQSRIHANAKLATNCSDAPRSIRPRTVMKYEKRRPKVRTIANSQGSRESISRWSVSALFLGDEHPLQNHLLPLDQRRNLLRGSRQLGFHLLALGIEPLGPFEVFSRA
jgi:hypothetical protein